MHHIYPSDITDHRSSGVLEIAWPDGTVGHLSHGLLRLQCRCGGCEQRRRSGTLPTQADPSMRLVAIEPVGDKGLNLAFSDGHDRGIYPWPYLHELSSGGST